MQRSQVVVLCLLLLISPSVDAKKTEFSQENAFAFLKILVEEIGPRPMGSPAEQRALDFAVLKFSEYGCQDSYVMPFLVAGGVNTSSGVAVGVLKGKTGRIIVIGGHIDSAGPDIPGANDDGSGCAVVMELARVLGKRQNESTIVFCCWGGEEEGLRGSKYFVDHFSMIDSVVLMLQVDMADGAGTLAIDPDARRQSAPRWLTEAAYEIFYIDLGYSNLAYPTHTASLNKLVDGFGSDHSSFLEKGIPAIDFSSDVSFPIHTPQDNLQNFTPSGLQRSGDLMLKLVERFDGATPPGGTERYMLVQLGTKPLFIDYWQLWTFVVLSVLFGVVAFRSARKRRQHEEATTRVKWSNGKLFLFAVIIQTFIWYSENVVGLISGHRFPWVNNFAGFVILGVLSGLIGLWIVLQLAPNTSGFVRWLRLSSDHYVFARVAFALFIIETVVASFGGPEIAVHVAAALFFFSLAMLVKHPVLKLILFAAAPYMMARLVFPEYLELVQRLLARNPIHLFWHAVLYNMGFVIFFTTISLPFIYGFAALYRSSQVDLLWLKRFRTKRGLVSVSLATVAMVIYLLDRSVYDKLWFANVKVEQRYTLGSDSSAITIRGGEFFKGVSMRADDKETVFTDRTNFYEFRPAQPSGVSWCSVIGRNAPAVDLEAKDSAIVFERRLEVHSTLRPLRVNIAYEASSAFEVDTPWAHRRERKGRGTSEYGTSFSWYSFPDTLLIVPMTFTLQDSQDVAETIEITYDTLTYPMQLNRALTNFSMRTIVTALDTIRIRRGAFRSTQPG